MKALRPMMMAKTVKLLVVDDQLLIRTSLSHIFSNLGHSVRSAVDGFSALVEIRNELPEILLSDLNMTGMSGFELLSVVRRRFPSIQVIAMSSDRIPAGIAADAFYEKGSDIRSLLRLVQTMTHAEHSSIRNRGRLAPIWIPKSRSAASGGSYVVITCPDCLRTFPQGVDEGICLIHETHCIHCSSSIHYAVIHSKDSSSPQAHQRKPFAEMSALHGPI
jgi:CheY-like chemotaxis protein